jgi:hypothetical protein
VRFDVIITRRGTDYVARVDKMPDIELAAPSRDALLEGVRQRLQDLARKVEMVSIDVDVPSMSASPFPGFGAFADDATFDDWQREIQDYRERQDRAGDR